MSKWYEVGKDVQQILRNQETIMAAIDDLRAKVAELQSAIDADQASDAAVIRALQQEVDELKALGGAGATPEQVAEIIAALDSAIADVSGPNEPTDVEGPVE